MPEKTIALALSGAEIKEALIEKFRQGLDRDCFFHRDAAYDTISGKVTWEIGLHAVDSVTATGAASLNVGDGEVSETQKGEVDIEPQPPNEVRIESGQTVPTDSGKRIKYSKETVRR